jgi:hypothetical protein
VNNFTAELAPTVAAFLLDGGKCRTADEVASVWVHELAHCLGGNNGVRSALRHAESLLLEEHPACTPLSVFDVWVPQSAVFSKPLANPHHVIGTPDRVTTFAGCDSVVGCEVFTTLYGVDANFAFALTTSPGSGLCDRHSGVFTSWRNDAIASWVPWLPFRLASDIQLRIAVAWRGAPRVLHDLVVALRVEGRRLVRRPGKPRRGQTSSKRAMRLWAGLFHFTQGFFGAHKVDLRNLP